jgi:isoleucyl-tRNA synthetase
MQPSIHLDSFVSLDKRNIDQALILQMESIREICSAALSIRKENQIRVRIPLKEMKILSNNLDLKFTEEYLSIIKDEVNIKSISIISGNFFDLAEEELIINLKSCGKKFGSKLKDIISAKDSKNYNKLNEKILIADCLLDSDDFDFIYRPKSVEMKVKCCLNKSVLIACDISADDAILQEATARDIIRKIQILRKEHRFEITDKILVYINTSTDWENKLKDFIENIKQETLANDIIFKPSSLSESSLEDDYLIEISKI